MENKINVDFSKLEESAVSRPKRTIWTVYIAAVILIVSAAGATYMIYNNMAICKPVVVLYLIFALCLVALCYIIYEVEYTHFSHAIEDAKANATLRRKLAEEAIMREIKIREKEISDAQKRKQESEK